MAGPTDSEKLAGLIGKEVVIDFSTPYLCLGTLAGRDEPFLELTDADLHDMRDSSATRENYVIDSVRYGIRRNRARVLVRLAEVVAIAALADVLQD